MSNLTSFILASFFLILSIWGFYFLIKKWSKFHITIFGKILKVLYALMLLLAIIISLVVAYDNFHGYSEDDRVRVVTEFQGVQLGWSKDEVLFRKGEPTSVDVKNDKETYLDYGATGIMLEKGIVVKILYVCQADSYSYEKIGGISCDSDISRIIKQYGDSKKLAKSEDKLSRIYNYPNYNLAFMLSKAKVEMLAVFDSTKVPNGFRFSHAWESALIVPNADIKKIDDDKPWEKYAPNASKKTYSIEEAMETTQEDAISDDAAK